jgi:hypothetical protein
MYHEFCEARKLVMELDFQHPENPSTIELVVDTPHSGIS